MGTFWFGYVLVLYILMETIYKLKVQVGYILTKPWVRFGRYVLTKMWVRFDQYWVRFGWVRFGQGMF